MSRATSAVQPHEAGHPSKARPGVLILSLIALVVVLDQGAKWWAWRHVPWATINDGGDILVGPTIGTWWAGRFTGALLDLVDFGLLSIAVLVLARSRRITTVSVLGALMLGGWGSNLLDRLGFHYLTAPGSVRGVVDFLPIGSYYYNIADFFIIGITPLFLLALGYQGVRAAMRPARAETVPPAPVRRQPRGWARMRVPALVAASLILVVTLGAAKYGGVNAASAMSAQQNNASVSTRTQGPG